MVCWTSVCCVGEGEEGYFEHVAVGELDVLAGEVVVQQEDAACGSTFVLAGGVLAFAVGDGGGVVVGGCVVVVVFGVAIGGILSIFALAIIIFAFAILILALTIIAFIILIHAIAHLRKKKDAPCEDAGGGKEIARLGDETLLLDEQPVEQEMLVGEQHGDAVVDDGEVEDARVVRDEGDGLQLVGGDEHVGGEEVERGGRVAGGGCQEDERVREPAGGGDELVGLGDRGRGSQRRRGRWRRPTGRWLRDRHRDRCR